MQAVELGYRDNPYHNAAHAADVVQTLGSMLLTEDFSKGLTAMELLAMLVAACCHDVGHPGERALRRDVSPHLQCNLPCRLHPQSFNMPVIMPAVNYITCQVCHVSIMPCGTTYL